MTKPLTWNVLEDGLRTKLVMNARDIFQWKQDLSLGEFAYFLGTPTAVAKVIVDRMIAEGRVLIFQHSTKGLRYYDRDHDEVIFQVNE